MLNTKAYKFFRRMEMRRNHYLHLSLGLQKGESIAHCIVCVETSGSTVSPYRSGWSVN